MEAPFLHEARKFPISKGGTMDKDPKASNRMVEEREDGTY